MPQQLFNFPGYFDREIDLTARTAGPVGVPAGLVGASLKGPAFVPYTIGSFSDFVTKFGGYDPKLPVPYAADKFLQNRNALTFVRILGAGANVTGADIDATRTAGIVKNAGFKISGSDMGIVPAVGSSEVDDATLFQDNDILALTASNGVIAEITFLTASVPTGTIGTPTYSGGVLVQNIGVAVTSSTEADVAGYIVDAIDLLRTVGASSITLPIFASVIGSTTVSFLQGISGPDGNTPILGIAAGAPFGAISGFAGGEQSKAGSVHFLVARHQLQDGQDIGMPMFTDNNSFPDASDGTGYVNLVRGVIFAASGSRIMIMSGSGESFGPLLDDVAVYSTPADSEEPYFKIVISTSLGSAFGSADGLPGIRILSASFNPTSDLYFAKLLNTDPAKFEQEQHYVYADFAVDDEVATVVQNTVSGVFMASGTDNTSATSGLSTTPFIELFGRFDTRFTTPKTPSFISQPYGSTEYDLFHIEAIDDGIYSNDKIKISIQNIVASTNPTYPYGSFTLTVRKFDDTDYNQAVIEQFNDLTLDPDSDKYIAKVIGDAKAYYNFDVEDPNDRRIIRSGKYPNQSNYIRVVMNEMVEQKMVPGTVVPFGFRGPQVLNTNPTFTDISGSSGELRLAGSGSADTFGCEGAIVPPVPFRFKVTRGAVSGSGLVTVTGPQEITDARLYWGVKFERNNNNVLNTNINNEANRVIQSFTRFVGIEKLDVLVTGSSTDEFNNNKFTLARVALGTTGFNYLTASVNTQMKNAVYVRNGAVDPTTYTVTGSCVSGNQLTFASLIHSGTQPIQFNRFNNFAKFTVFMYGGFDGVNILDQHAQNFDDRSTSTEFGVGGYGGAHQSYDSPGFDFNQNGVGILNNQVNSYRVATDIITNPIASNINLLGLPGQREPFVTDYASDAVANYGLALYAMDVPNYNSDGVRIFDGTTTGTGSYINVQNTADNFDSRALNNTFVAAYFPDVVIPDPQSGKRVTVPATVASLAAIGYNDKVAYPWFAPAGFNRAALNFVTLTRTRVNQNEREKLYQVRVNPIVKFPNEGYVIFAQKTLDGDQTSLDSINVQRMVMDVQRQVIDIGNRLIWEQLTPSLYTEFVSKVSPVLALVQARGGIRQFKVVCDGTNNTDLDRENNRMNAKIYLLPVKAVEFIAVDFIITRAGVQFG